MLETWLCLSYLHSRCSWSVLHRCYHFITITKIIPHTSFDRYLKQLNQPFWKFVNIFDYLHQVKTNVKPVGHLGCSTNPCARKKCVYQYLFKTKSIANDRYSLCTAYRAVTDSGTYCLITLCCRTLEGSYLPATYANLRCNVELGHEKKFK